METKHSNLQSSDKIIPQDVMTRIEHLDRSLFTPDEQFHIDLFLLGYHLGGIGLKNLAYLTWDKIKGAELDCRAIPYPHVASVPINDNAKEIIERYREHSLGAYILPIFSSKQKTAAQREGYVKRLSAKANVTFRKIEQVIGCGSITRQGSRLAFIAGMVENKIHIRDIYAFAGSTAMVVEAEYCKQPGYMDEIYKRMNQRM